MVRSPEYTDTVEIADWLGIDINSNTDPNTTMVNNWIMDNEDLFNSETGHSWLTKSVYSKEVFDVSDIYDYGRGLYLPLKHRQIKSFDEAEGDLLEIWDGTQFVQQSIASLPNTFINFDESKGVMYIRGYIYTILRKSRFRLTYRYGGSKEIVDGQTIPRDVKKAVKLMTCIDILSRDFKMSQIAYGGEGNVNKKDMIEKWQKMIDKIIWNRSEMLTVY